MDTLKKTAYGPGPQGIPRYPPVLQCLSIDNIYYHLDLRFVVGKFGDDLGAENLLQRLRCNTALAPHVKVCRSEFPIELEPCYGV